MAEVPRSTDQEKVHQYVGAIEKAPLPDTVFDQKTRSNAKTLALKIICDYYSTHIRSLLMHLLAKLWDDPDNPYGIYSTWTRYAERLMFEEMDDNTPITNDYDTLFAEFFSSYTPSQFDDFKSLVQELNIKIHFKPTPSSNRSIPGICGNTEAFTRTLQQYMSSVVNRISH
eukprot:151448_1